MIIRLLLYPVSLIYGFLVSIRNLMFDYGLLKSEQFHIPIISVGNITVGGTGKTPHVEYLAKVFQDEIKLAVLSRGYKRKTKGFVLASEISTSKEIGDEPLQIKRKLPKIEVAVCESRVEGAKKLIQMKNELILLDDAFQHRYIKPGLSILLVDFNRPVADDYLLPCGHLRENPAGMKRADIIIVSKTPLELKPIDRRIIFEQLKIAPYQEMYFTGIQYGKFKPVYGTNSNTLSDFFKNHEIYTILLITGIASPTTLISELKKYTLDIRHVKFTDHSNYDKLKFDKVLKEFRSIENDKKIILTTEKDAIKMQETELKDNVLISNLYYIPIEIKFIDKEEEFKQQIKDYVRKNKRNN